MNQYQIDGKVYAVMDNELWIKVEGSEASVSLEKPSKLKYKHREPKGNKKPGRRGGLDSETKQEIIEVYKLGVRNGELARRYGFDPATISRTIKGTARKKTQQANHPWSLGSKAPAPSVDREMYQCENGHQFKSNLSLDRVMCPDCKSRNIDIYQEPPVEEGEAV